jgi:hypoxanthine-DNA glycosylase
MPRVRSFAPVAADDARILILGSMPGERSLAMREYYAHPQNRFWRILGSLTGIAHDAPYAARIESLRDAGIALWDVLASCRRKSSLDSAIERDSMRPNDFAAFLAAHPRVTHVFFNGATAEAVFQRHVRAALRERLRGRLLYYERLPSTSPAHAGMPYVEKARRWRAALKRGLSR